MRWIFHVPSILGLTLADELCDHAAPDDDLYKAFDVSIEEDSKTLKLLQVGRIASQTVGHQTLEVESNATKAWRLEWPKSWLEETVRAVGQGRWMPLLVFVGLALLVGFLILLFLQRLENSKKTSWPRRGILQCFSDGERAGVAGAKSGRSLPEDYAQLFEAQSFKGSKLRRWCPGMGASFTPGPVASPAEFLVSKGSTS